MISSQIYTARQSYCNYGNLHKDMIHDRIVVGISDNKLSLSIMQLEPDLTLI